MDSRILGPSSASMIAAASLLVAGGNFSQQNVTHNHIANSGGRRDGFQQLQHAVAPAAFHNSDERFDSPKCYPNTRMTVLSHVMEWIMQSPDRDTWIMWLNGAAGAGKSAIAQTIAELCEKAGILLATFFFSRGDPTRNHEKALIATIAYQLILSLPALNEYIVRAIELDPLIFNRTLEIQLKVLILEPLAAVHRLHRDSETGNLLPHVIIIDGLDECAQPTIQSMIVSSIVKTFDQSRFPITFLIASRPEQRIAVAFCSRTTIHCTTHLALDDRYLPKDDIHVYLMQRFAEVKEAHPFRSWIPLAWPPEQQVDELVRRSSGQFIYAYVVSKFIISLEGRPHHRLDVILGLRPNKNGDMPFAELDAVYMYIFESLPDPDLVRRILMVAFLTKITSICHIEIFLGLEAGDLAIACAGLLSLVSIQRGFLGFTHASLRDFFFDSSRSKHLHINPSEGHTIIARNVITRHSRSGVSDLRGKYWSAHHYSENFSSCLPMDDIRQEVIQLDIKSLLSCTTLASHITLARLINLMYLIKSLRFDDIDEICRPREAALYDFISTSGLGEHSRWSFDSDKRLL